MKLIVTADRNWGIGKDGKIPVAIPADGRRFQSLTEGYPVAVGRKSAEIVSKKGLSKSSPLYVLTADDAAAVPAGALRVADPSLIPPDAFVTGGEETFHALLPLCDTVYVTAIDYMYASDAFFPDLDADPEWELAEESEEATYFDLIYTFRTYRRI